MRLLEARLKEIEYVVLQKGQKLDVFEQINHRLTQNVTTTQHF
jgi:hypothetical protein